MSAHNRNTNAPTPPAGTPAGGRPGRMRPEGWQTVCARFPTARLLWDAPVPGGHLRAYSIDADVFLIHDYADGHGWQVYSPTTTSGKVDETLDAIEARARGMDYDWRGRG